MVIPQKRSIVKENLLNLTPINRLKEPSKSSKSPAKKDGENTL